MSHNGTTTVPRPGPDGTTPSTAPERCNEAGFKPPEHQGFFSFPPGAYPMAFLIMTLGINFAVIELSTFSRCAKHSIHFLLFIFPANDFFIAHL